MHYRISGVSMEPDFKEGVLVFAIPANKLDIGDVVVLKDPRDTNRTIIKRIVETKDDKMMLQGDNIDQSTDSRTFGEVDKSEVLGRVIFRYPRGLAGWLRLLVVLLAVVGLSDSSYLTFKHFEGGEISCEALPGADCDLVLGSMYSEIFGIPLALLGALYYLAVLVLGLIYIGTRRDWALKLLLLLTAIGFIVSVYLVYLQIFVITALCAFCMVSALTSTILFGIAIKLVLLNRKGRA